MTTLMPGAIRPFPHYVMTNTSLRNTVPSTTTSKDANIHLPSEPERGAAPELPSQYWVAGDMNTTMTNSMPVQGFTVSASAHEFAQTVKTTSRGQLLANAPAVLEIHTKFGALQLDGFTHAGIEQDAQQHFAKPCYGKSDVSHSMDAQQAIASRCDGNGQIGHQHQELFGNARFYHSETHTSRDKELSMSQEFAFRGHSIVGDSGEQTVHQFLEDDSADKNNLIARYCTTTRQVTDYGANVPISCQHIANEPHASLGATAEPSHRQLMNGKSDFGRSITSYYVASQRNTDLSGDGQLRRGNVEPGETCNGSASSTAQYVGNVDGPMAHDYAADAQILLNSENQVAPRWKATKQNAGISGGVQHALEFKDDQKSIGQGTNVPGKAIIGVGGNDGDRHITHNVLNGMGQPMPVRTVLQHGSVDHAMKRHNSLRGNGKRDGNKQHASQDVITNHDGKVQNPQTECSAESNAGHQHTTHKTDGNGQNSAEKAAPPHASVVKLAEFCANMVHQMWHVRGVSSYETADWPPNVPLHASANFKNWCYHVLTLTQLSETAVMLALKYIQMLIRSGRFSKIELGNQYRLCAVAFVLANKWLDDSTYLNKTWAEVTGIPLAELNGKEMSVLGSLEFNVQVSPDEYKQWIDSLQAYTKKQDELLYASPQPPAMVMPEPFDYLRPLTSSAGMRMPMPEQHPQRFVGGLAPPPGFMFPPQEQPLRSAQEDDRAGKPAKNVLHSTDSKNIREPSAYLGHAKRYSMPNARELTREPAEQRRPSRLRPADAVALLSDSSLPLSTGNQTQSNVTASVAAVPTASPAAKARTFSSLADFTRWYEQNTSTATNPSNTFGVAGKQSGAEMSLVNVHANAAPRKSSLLDLLATDTSRRSQRHLSMPDFTRGCQAVHFKKEAFEPIKSAESDVYEQKSSFADLVALLKSQQVIPGKDRQRIGVTIPYASSPEPLHRTPQLVRHDVERFGGCAQPHTAIHGNSAINRKECCSPQTPVDVPRCGMDDDFANVSHGKPYGVNQAEQGIGLGGLLFLNHEDGKALL